MKTIFFQDIQHVSESSKVVHNQEIQQDALKTQIVSAITDLEGDRDFVDFGRKNKPIDLTSPPQSFSPVPKSTFTPTKQVRKSLLTVCIHLFARKYFFIKIQGRNSCSLVQSSACNETHRLGRCCAPICNFWTET